MPRLSAAGISGLQDAKDVEFEVVPAKRALPAVEILAGDICDDDEAIRVFLASYSRRSPHTVRSYTKECRRFLLWLRATRDRGHATLPTVTVQDVHDYLDYLSNPRPFGARFLQAHGWKQQPFRGPLGSESVKHCITVLHRMFAALRELRTAGNQPYCLFNPVVLAHEGIAGTSTSDEQIEQALTLLEWQAVQATIESLPRETTREVQHYHRARWVMQLLYRTFLRRGEAAELTMGGFERGPDGWSIRLVGKGNKKAKIVATEKLIAELAIYRESLGLTPLPSPGEARPAILSVTGNRRVSAQAIYLLCRALFDRAADRLEASDSEAAARLRVATPHWMRHTGITHALEAGAHARYVQAQARHSSLNVTARYDHKERQAWRRHLESMD